MLFRSVTAGIRALLRRQRDSAELDEELRQFVEAAAQEKIAAGMSPEAAWRTARAELGSAEAVKDEVRDVGWESRLYSVWQDLRYAIRMLKNSPGFTAVAVLSLALAIGANTALFSVFDSVFLKPLPVRDPSALVMFAWVYQPEHFDVPLSGSCYKQDGLPHCTSFSSLFVERMRAENRTLDDVFAFAPIDQLNVNVDGTAEIASGQVVTGDYYRGIGASFVAGRPITPDDDRTNAAPVAVISYAYWQRRFGADPHTIGRKVQINNAVFTIVGVSGPGFVGANDEFPLDVTLPIALDRTIRGRGTYRPGDLPVLWWLCVMGRRNSGVSIQQVQANFEPVFRQAAWETFQMGPAQPENAKVTFADTPTLNAVDGSRGLFNERSHYFQSVMILLAMVGLILLIACVNVANMLLARAEARQREITVRLAIGAARSRVARQLLTESILLAFIAGSAGAASAYAVRDTLVALVPWANGVQVNMDWRVLAFTVGVSLATGLLFGMAPALHASRMAFSSALKEGAKGTTGSRGASMGKALVVIQVALSVVLLIAAGLFLRTLRNLENVDVGFDTRNVLLFRVDPRLSGYKPAMIDPLYQRLIDRLAAIPGVKGVTASRQPLLSGGARVNTVHIGEEKRPSAYVNVVEPRFFETMGIPILEGRGITAHDDFTAPHIAVINRQAARTYFGAQNPIGQRIGLGWNNPDWFEIVGIARDAKYTKVRQDMPPTVYIALRQEEGGQVNFELRTGVDPTSLIPAVRAAVHEIDGNLPIFELKTQTDRANESISQERLFAGLSSSFGGLALLLAAIGLFGIMSYSVARRTSEIAIRMALGAKHAAVLAMVIRETLTLVVAGAVVGVPCALAIARLAETTLSKVLYEVKADDPVTFIVASAGLVVIGLLAAYLPARRAASVDPMMALRYE